MGRIRLRWYDHPARPSFDGFNTMTIDGISAEPNIVKLMRAPVGSDAFEYYGNMTYASGTATATISLNGKYKAMIGHIGTAPEVGDV